MIICLPITLFMIKLFNNMMFFYFGCTKYTIKQIDTKSIEIHKKKNNNNDNENKNKTKKNNKPLIFSSY